ncbi:MarR family transcriptional regulator [Haladaptatus salinisoli]|uniref:MarR family transcriptional regulator n=1 Tax=Haladaptatus salinisoli TaxID=2884876 RepID=UPI001D0A8229|nr:helix-turn-helix domain-containing protein [Haladaptatus salinisoli]
MQHSESAQSREHDLEESEAIEVLSELPPSAKLVAKALEYDNPLTQTQLEVETMLPPRTIRYALTRLEENDLVESRFSFADARKRYYSLTFE